MSNKSSVAKKKARPVSKLTGLIILAMTYSHPEGLPSAHAGLASVFGMGTGVSPRIYSPGSLLYPAPTLKTHLQDSPKVPPPNGSHTDYIRQIPKVGAG